MSMIASSGISCRVLDGRTRRFPVGRRALNWPRRVSAAAPGGAVTDAGAGASSDGEPAIWASLPEPVRKRCDEAARAMTAPGCGRPLALLGLGLAFLPLFHPRVAISQIAGNVVAVSAFWAWLFAQTLKLFTGAYVNRKWDWHALFQSGGMPSSHSSLCTGLTTAIVLQARPALEWKCDEMEACPARCPRFQLANGSSLMCLAFQHGFGSTLFPMAAAFSVIVMYDAAGVRRHAGQQAEVLNEVVRELFEHPHPLSETELKEVLGHTPLQVACGAALGISVAWAYRIYLGV